MLEIQELLKITDKLRTRYSAQKRTFTLDGKLVGDIGEVLAAEKYGLELLPPNEPDHDGIEISSLKKVQIKATMKGYFQFPAQKTPDYFLAIVITQKGEINEIFNGTGQFVRKHYIQERGLKPHNNSYFMLSKNILGELNRHPENSDKILQL